MYHLPLPGCSDEDGVILIYITIFSGVIMLNSFLWWTPVGIGRNVSFRIYLLKPRQQNMPRQLNHYPGLFSFGIFSFHFAGKITSVGKHPSKNTRSCRDMLRFGDRSYRDMLWFGDPSYRDMLWFGDRSYRDMCESEIPPTKELNDPNHQTFLQRVP